MRSNNVFNVILFSSLVAGVAACAGPLDDSAIDEGTGGADGDAIEAGGSGEGLRAGFQKVAIDGDLVIADGPTSKLDPPSAEFDACDPGGGGGGAGPGGLLVSVNDTTDLTFQATTVGGNDDFKTFCGDSNTETAAPDVVYRLEVSDNCILGVTVTDSSSFNPALEIRRTSCATEVGGDSCANRATNVEEMRFEAAPGSTYWAIIDGSTLDDAGDFLIHITCEPPTCGDRIVSGVEECDDGNAVSGDGCDACTVEAADASNTCADLGATPISIALDDVVSYPGAGGTFSNGFAGTTNDYIGSCGWEEGGLDQVFDIVPAASGILTVNVGYDGTGTTPYCQAPDYDSPGCVDHTLFVREGSSSQDCDNDALEIACQQSNADDLTNVLSFPVTAGNHYYVFVDGYDGEWYSTGQYNLGLALTAQ